MLENLEQSLKNIFSQDAQEKNLFHITTPEKAYEDGYFSLKLQDKKIILHGVMKICLLDEKDPYFRQGLEKFVKTDGEINQLSRKYIQAFNKTCSMHITPFLREKNFQVEGDGEPDWIITYEDDLSESIEQCHKNRDLIMSVADKIDRIGFGLAYRDNQRYYAGTRSNMMKEARDNALAEKATATSPVETSKKATATSPLKIKILSHHCQDALEKEVNQWFIEHQQIDLNGLEFKTCPHDNRVENTVFIVYK